MIICDLQKPAISLSALTLIDLLDLLASDLQIISYQSLFNELESSTTVVKQIIYRAAILCKDKKTSFSLTLESAERKANIIVNSRRKRFVRRIWRKYPLFALQIIQERYRDYSEELLIEDLYKQKPFKRNKIKAFKKTTSFGLRVSQIQKLTGLLKFSDIQEKERNTICNKIAGYYNGLKLKTPILLSVNYSGEKREYSFAWNETEAKIKTFVGLTKNYNTFSELDNAWRNRFIYGN